MSKKLKTQKPLKNVSSKYEEKVKRIMLMIELESGKAFVAKITDIGKSDGLITLKDLTRKLSNDKDESVPKFESPVVFTLDLRQAAREHFDYYWNRNRTVALWIGKFFNLEDK